MTINKWVYYILYVKNMGLRLKKSKKQEKIARENYINNCATVAPVTMLCLFQIAVSVSSCNQRRFKSVFNMDSFKTLISNFNLVISVIYSLFAIVIIVVGVTFMLVMRKEHHGFYQNYRCKLVFAILCLAIPMVVRCVLDFLMSTKGFHDYIYKTEERLGNYNLIFFLTTDYSIILSQTAAFLFGVLRQDLKK